jgi:hypothetical protein
MTENAFSESLLALRDFPMKAGNQQMRATANNLA